MTLENVRDHWSAVSDMTDANHRESIKVGTLITFFFVMIVISLYRAKTHETYQNVVNIIIFKEISYLIKKLIKLHILHKVFKINGLYVI